MTAQVVGRKDLIAGAAHGFFNADCTPHEVQRCEFHLLSQPRRIFKIDTIVINDCVLGGKLNSRDDWFVAELKELTSATPYLVPDAPVVPKVGDQLVQVASQAKNGWKNTPNIVTCSVRDVSYRLTPYLTDCSNGHGTSGAAQLQPSATLNNRWVLNAVAASQNELGHDGGEFDLTATYTSSAPVNGEFWQTLADKLRGTPEAFEKSNPPQAPTDSALTSHPFANSGAFPWSDCMSGCKDR
jgi:hypothetical protein